MTVPNLPYWLNPIHTEFGTNGAISNAGRKAGLPSQFWCSQFEGKSSMPRRLFHGICNAMSDGNYTMQDLSIWGPGYTYVVDVTACADKISCQMLTFVVNWNPNGTMDYYSDVVRAIGVDPSTYNHYLRLQYENDGDANEVWISLRPGNLFSFKMQEGSKHGNDYYMDCCIDVWAYEYGSHPVSTLTQAPADRLLRAGYLVRDSIYPYAYMQSASDKMQWVYGNSYNFPKYPKSYNVVIGKKYIATLSYTDIVTNSAGFPVPVKVVLGQSIIRVMNNADFVQPWNGSYDAGGPGVYIMIQYGSSYGGSPLFGEDAPFYVLVPPRSWAAGTVTRLLSCFDVELVEIP